MHYTCLNRLRHHSPEIYKAQQESQAGGAQPGPDAGPTGGADDSAADDVQDVDFEEVKED